MTPKTTTALRSLQAGRGLAALGVVVFHLNNSLWGIPKYFSTPFWHGLAIGKAGVQFFFVLSGFIILLVHQQDIGRAYQLPHFLEKRFVRIYPTYWIILIAVVVILVLDPGLEPMQQRSAAHVITSLFLLPYSQEPLLSVAWTLEHEVLFYAVFALCIVHRTAGIICFAVWQAACAGNIFVGATALPLGTLLSANNLLFALGLIAAALYKSDRCPSPGWMALGGLVGFTATGAHEVFAMSPLPDDIYVLSFGFFSAAIILGLRTFEHRFGLLTPRWLNALGDASYSLYLIHLPLLSLYGKLLFASGLAAMLPQPLSFILMLIVLSGSGIVFHLFVEMPLITRLAPRRRRLSQSHTIPRPLRNS